ncbi:uncharacterized protein LOC120073714 [Benincasa hispida]|uniref:uncharacterized protein LOC120073714 n=1 Tax=Benincasa hispida TaxID=102211 RepID=UPI001901FA06|nr:uncharacterized protein LOC120073714 [Benincasa hispida]
MQTKKGVEKTRSYTLITAIEAYVHFQADHGSLSFVNQVLSQFAELSGLVANMGKSSMFVAGVSCDVARELARSMGFVLGSLPIHYLGLPLLSGKLKVMDYVPLI